MSDMDYRVSVAYVRAILDKFVEAAELRPSDQTSRAHDARWHIAKVLGMAERLIETGPFRPGERVALTRTPVITREQSWGWMCAKHYLVEGAVGTVRHVDFSAEDKNLFAYVEFDDETWVDDAGVKRPVIEKHVYRFREGWLRRIEGAKS